jgi:hypothetical protein
MKIEPTYLGDAVYASYDGFAITLTTNHHDPRFAGAVIVMEPEVLWALDTYRKNIERAREAQQKNETPSH